MENTEVYGTAKFSFPVPTGFLAPFPLLCGRQWIESPLQPKESGKALLVYIIAGEGSCVTGEGTGRYSRNHLICAYDAAVLMLEPEAKTDCIFLLLENAVPLPAELPPGPLHPLAENNPVLHMLMRIYRNAVTGRAGSIYDAAADIFRLLMKLCALCVQQEKKHSPVVGDAIDCMRKQFAFLTGMDDLAERIGVSKCHLIRTFSHEIGMTPGSYLQNIRLENAMLLLRGREYGIDAVAGLCGFSGANYFCKVFRKALGESPGEYRGRVLMQGGLETESVRRLLEVESHSML